MVVMLGIEVFNLLQVHLVQVIAEHRVVEVDKFTKMSVSDKGSVGLTELVSSCKLNLYHSELILRGRLASVNIKVDFVDV